MSAVWMDVSCEGNQWRIWKREGAGDPGRSGLAEGCLVGVIWPAVLKFLKLQRGTGTASGMFRQCDFCQQGGWTGPGIRRSVQQMGT
ncbi:hypothetical protein CPSG_09746 [Coccidioides posadasii str. Silveira]|uniref:Uncharacterized protein n=1 Tax=Coccidioides posadasii (strain RMSCC 757 / Silveira) TaxID=443226 RepID=E9DIV3_COCPS|nr:hypothetical protein CPSG_09746 [Coccidioides posadasii str. Silveira]